MGVHNHSRVLLTLSAYNVSNGSTDVVESCEPSKDFQHSLYAATYTIIFVPGLLTNSVALWILCHFVNKQNKMAVFMVNLAAADFIHVLSLPLRIFYYVNYTWPFGRFLCQLCFYLKYFNMYASICFLTCISVQRYFFLLHPFKAKNWKRRYDVAVCGAVWLVIGAACLLFPLLRSAESSGTCFTDLSIKKIGSKTSSVVTVMAAEVVGFFAPLIIIVYCTWKTKASLQEHDILQQSMTEKLC